LNEYYDTTLEREATAFDGASIFSTLEGLYQHFLVPKAGGSALERGSKVSHLEAAIHVSALTVPDLSAI
jgi:hypothetical protein